MSAPPWMLLRLAVETASHHTPADEDRLTGLEIRTIDDYRSFLARIVGFEAIAETAIIRATTRELSPHFFDRYARATLLRADLRTLGVPDLDHAGIPSATNVHIPSPAHALGWVFVLARHALVAGQIRRHLEHALGDAVAGVTSYLDACCDRPGARFRSLGEHLGELALRYQPRVIVDGANDAFRAQRHWYRVAAVRRDPIRTRRPSRDDAAA